MSRPAGSAGGTTPGTRRRGLGGHTLLQIVFCDAEIVDEALRSMGRSVWQHCRFTPELQSRLRDGDAYEALLDRQVVQAIIGNVAPGNKKHGGDESS